MDKQSCRDKIDQLIRDALQYGKGDCERDYETQHYFREELKAFISSAVVDAMPWHKALDGICFTACSGPISGRYDKKMAQEVFENGWNTICQLLIRLKGKIDNCSDSDIRWNISYDGGV